MKVGVESNFVIEGLSENEINLERESISLNEFLSVLSSISGGSLEFFDPAGEFQSDSWEIEVNGVRLSDLKEGLSFSLKDGDRVGLKILVLGGG